MTANREKTERGTSNHEIRADAPATLDLGQHLDAALKVVSADGSTIIPSRPTLPFDSASLSMPPSSTDISTLSGPLDLSRPPAGIDRVEPDISFHGLEADLDPVADRVAPSTGLGSAHFEAHPAAIGLQSDLKSGGNDCGAPSVGRTSIQPAPMRTEAPTSVEMKRSGFDAHLARTIDAWPSLPMHVRETIVTIIEATLNG